MGLFNQGDFELHSGHKSNFLIDCNALDNSDLEALAELAYGNLPPFRLVVPVPRGGVKFAAKFLKYVYPEADNILVVDDVWTTGQSINNVVDKIMNEPLYEPKLENIYGLVIFNRSAMPLPQRVKAVWSIDL